MKPIDFPMKRTFQFSEINQMKSLKMQQEEIFLLNKKHIRRRFMSAHKINKPIRQQKAKVNIQNSCFEIEDQKNLLSSSVCEYFKKNNVNRYIEPEKKLRQNYIQEQFEHKYQPQQLRIGSLLNKNKLSYDYVTEDSSPADIRNTTYNYYDNIYISENYNEQYQVVL